jgi:GMP synthase (glutamine-hydrolysing)
LLSYDASRRRRGESTPGSRGETHAVAASTRVRSSDDLEVAAYLEVAREKAGEQPDEAPPLPDHHPRESVVIFDFGSQFSMLIARRVRELGVYCELVSPKASSADVQRLNPRAFILSGGPASVYEPDAPQVPDFVFETGLPILGICYGMQLLAHQLGGRVAPDDRREYGPATIHRAAVDGDPLFSGLPESLPVWMSHGDRIAEMPPGFSSLAYSENSPVAVMGNGHGYVGLQFHPEVVHTPAGTELLRNFLFEIAGLKGDWSAGHFIEESIAAIRADVRDGHVICALSGGVDSAVTAALVHRAIGDQLTCIFVDNGLMRRDEPERVVETFQRHMKIKLIHVDARERFLRALVEVTNPETKRMRIGEEFIRVFEAEARKLGKVDFIAQGTTYPDVVESASTDLGTAAKIKTHHNVGGLPADMTFQLIEPLRHLFKDEVRQVGLELGLPEEMVYRQPFPGPGLAIRVAGEVTEDRLEMLRGADSIVMEEIKKAGLYRDLWQSFAVLTDTRTVGVMGDFRTYGYAVAIRAVSAEDAMTADWARLPHDLLARMANRIVNEVAGVNRVVYDITSKPPGTIEWE